VACLIVAVDKAFGTGVPGGTHEGGVVPRGGSIEHCPEKLCFQFLPSFIRNFEMWAAFFGDALLFGFVRLPSLPLSLLLAVMPRHGVGSGNGFLGGDLIKLGGRITVRELFITILKTLSKETRRLLTIKQHTKEL
jgi:hypothetical protein